MTTPRAARRAFGTPWSARPIGTVQIVLGLMFILLGATCVAYLWAGGSVFEGEPPLLALGVLLIALAARLAGRRRTAGLLARAALGAGIVAIAWMVARYLALDASETLMRRLYLLGIALAVAGIVSLFVVVRRVRRAPRLRLADVAPLAGMAVALALGMVWLVRDDARLRACRLGTDAACDVVATRLLEAAERAPAAAPTRWEEKAARALEATACRSPEPGSCAPRRYALGTVALRAGRLDAARDAFRRACEEDATWCARAEALTQAAHSSR